LRWALLLRRGYSVFFVFGAKPALEWAHSKSKGGYRDAMRLDEYEVIEEQREQQEEQERERDLAAEWLAANDKKAERSEKKRVAGGHGEVRTWTPEEIAALPIPSRTDGDGTGHWQKVAQSRKQRLKDGFYAYLATGDIDLLLKRTQEYVERRFKGFDYEQEDQGAEGQMRDTCDYVQNILIRVWEGIDPFTGDSDDYERWVNVLCTNRIHEARRERNKNRQTFTPVTITVGEDNGRATGLEPEDDLEEIQNKEISAMQMAAQASAHRRYWRFDKDLLLPDSVQGTDRWICELLESGKDRSEIAKEVGLTKRAVEGVIYRLKQQLAPEYTERKKAQAARLAERDAEYNEQLAIRQRTRTRITAKSAFNADDGSNGLNNLASAEK
jgi:DNA-directed RNA polymerase specialized sigma24 family protein